MLWCAVQAVKTTFPASHIAIYGAWDCDAAADNATHIHSRVKTQFGLDISHISFTRVNISSAVKLVDPTSYPRLTLILQAFGTIVLGAIAYTLYPTDAIIDTANLTFGLVVPKLVGARTASYVHYPTISTDMLEVVRTRRQQFNNDARIASSPWKTHLKTMYYRAFACFYGIIATCVDVKIANSSWTAPHLRRLWSGDIDVVFPPCNIEKNDDLSNARDSSLIVSVGQFRPEKNHSLQLDVMQYLKECYPELQCRLLMIGGARDEKDVARAKRLQKRIESDGLAAEVRVNMEREELRDLLRQACVGIHTMRDEHFGISVVELQVSGLIVVAHRSGGVAVDIVCEGETGFLAGDSAKEYGEAVARAMRMKEEDKMRMRLRSLQSCERFSEEVFRRNFAEIIRRRLGLDVSN